MNPNWGLCTGPENTVIDANDGRSADKFEWEDGSCENFKPKKDRKQKASMV